MASDGLYRPLEAFKPLFWLLRFLSDDHQAAWCMESISMLSLIGRIPLIGVLRAGSGYYKVSMICARYFCKPIKTDSLRQSIIGATLNLLEKLR